MFGDAELRFPLIEAALTPIGVLGGVRGVFFFNIGAGWWEQHRLPVPPRTRRRDRHADRRLRLRRQWRLTCRFRVNNPTTISGFRLQDGRASYGVGLETFALGFPIHFDWSWRTLFNKDWENAVFASSGGSAAFRKARFSVWIGYDF